MCIRDSSGTIPRRKQMAKALERPGTPISRRYVGRRVVTVSYTHLDVYKRQGIIYPVMFIIRKITDLVTAHLNRSTLTGTSDDCLLYTSRQ